MFLYDPNIIGSPLTPEIFGKCSGTISWSLDNFWGIFGNLQKVLGNLRKIVKNVVLPWSSLVCLFSKIQLVVYYQCCVLIG